MVEILGDKVAQKVDLNDPAQLVKVVQSCIGTKFISRWSDLAVKIAIDAVKTVTVENSDAESGAAKEIDTKRYAKVEKIPGGTIEDSRVLRGVMFNKDVTHPKMARRIENPRILLLDCNLEYKKGESQTNIEMMKEEDFTQVNNLFLLFRCQVTQTLLFPRRFLRWRRRSSRRPATRSSRSSLTSSSLRRACPTWPSTSSSRPASRPSGGSERQTTYAWQGKCWCACKLDHSQE